MPRGSFTALFRLFLKALFEQYRPDHLYCICPHSCQRKYYEYILRQDSYKFSKIKVQNRLSLNHRQDNTTLKRISVSSLSVSSLKPCLSFQSVQEKSVSSHRISHYAKAPTREASNLTEVRQVLSLKIISFPPKTNKQEIHNNT